MPRKRIVPEYTFEDTLHFEKKRKFKDTTDLRVVKKVLHHTNVLTALEMQVPKKAYKKGNIYYCGNCHRKMRYRDVSGLRRRNLGDWCEGCGHKVIWPMEKWERYLYNSEIATGIPYEERQYKSDGYDI